MPVIKELLFDRTRGEYVGERITRCPADVEMDTVASWLKQRYGPPFNTARTIDEEVGEIQVGWVYDPPADWLSANSEAQELVAMPMLVGDDGEPTDSAFLAQAELHRNMRALPDREGIPLKVISPKPRPYKAEGRLRRAPATHGRAASIRRGR